MSDDLEQLLSSLPEGAIDRIARKVLGTGVSGRHLAERAIAQHLCDPVWVGRTVDALGVAERRALELLVRLGHPVSREDVASLFATRQHDPFDELEQLGLVLPVRTGKGMPSHVTSAPGLAFSSEVDSRRRGDVEQAARLAGERQRFERAVLLGTAAAAGLRVTSKGRVHATDLQRLKARFVPWTEAALSRELDWMREVGVLSIDGGRLVLGPRAEEIESLLLIAPLAELADEALDEQVLRVVSGLLRSGGTLPLGELIDRLRAGLLGEDVEDEGRRIRRELAQVVGDLLGLRAVLLLDEAGALLTPEDALRRTASGEPCVVAIDPAILRILDEEAPPERGAERGWVLPNLEVVAGPGCDLAAVSVVAAFAGLQRLEQVGTWRLDRRSMQRGLEAGGSAEALAGALQSLGEAVPDTVVALLSGGGGADAAAPMRSGEQAPVDWQSWREAVSRRLAAVAGEEGKESVAGGDGAR